MDVLTPINRTSLRGVNPGLLGRGATGADGVAGFDAPLRNNLYPDRMDAGKAPTFTRATAGTVTDHEGVIRTARSGEARFHGSRRVENLLAADSSDDWSNVSLWPLGGTATITGTNTINLPATNDFTRHFSSEVITAGDVYSFSVTLNGSGTTTLRIAGSTVAENTDTQVTLTATPTRYVVLHTYTNAQVLSYVMIRNHVGDTATTLTAADAQLENVTGASDTTIPSDYVSTMCVDYAGNLGPGLLTNGDFSAWTADDPDDWTVTGEVASDPMVTEVSGAARFYSGDTDNIQIDQSLITTPGNAYLFSGNIVDATAGALEISSATPATEVDAEGSFSKVYVAGTTSFVLKRKFVGGGSTDVTIDNVSLKKILFPAGVVGVQYFDTTNGNTVASNVVTEATGTPIANATLRGYLAEGARTNLGLYSDQFDHATWVKTTTTITADSTASPDGATTADTLTATGANSTSLQTVTSASATRDFSIYLKRKTGTGNIDLTVDNGATWTTKAITASWARYDITQAAVANPVFGVRIVTSGDEVYAWGSQLESASFPSSPIYTTTTAVTRDADVLTYPSAGNIFDAAGSVVATVQRDVASGISSVIGGTNTTTPLYTNSSTLRMYDGTTDHSGVTWNDTASHNVGSNWGSGSMNTFIDGTSGTAVSFDGSMDIGNTLYVGDRNDGLRIFNGTIRDLRIYDRALSDSQMEALTQ